VLSRGYSITRRADGQVVRSVAAAPAGARLQTRLADGTVNSVVQPLGQASTSLGIGVPFDRRSD
jgi:exodeoxyribonuclease VII large subunit